MQVLPSLRLLLLVIPRLRFALHLTVCPSTAAAAAPAANCTNAGCKNKAWKEGCERALSLYLYPFDSLL